MDNSELQQSIQGDAYDPTNTYGEEDMDEDDDDEYDPSNMQFQDAQASDQPATDGSGDTQQAALSKQRVVGGPFIEDDDDEDDTPAENVTGQDIAAALGSAGQQQRSVTQTPVNNATPDISINQAATTVAAADAQDQGFSGVTVPSININSAPSTNGVGVSAGPTPSQSPLPPSVVASSSTVPLPKARLPQDRVGILEDRIAADPRGDTDAWLSLIEEYKQRNKIEEVYETYERFLKIFSQAVGFGTILPSANRLLTCCRVTNGQRTSRP
jgi:cleavage stimulation factor subunit 3